MMSLEDLAEMLGRMSPEQARSNAESFINYLVTGQFSSPKAARTPGRRRIYVASSWRNPFQPDVCGFLRMAGHQVYDFRNPPRGTGFGWREIDPNWTEWSFGEWVEALDHPRAVEGFGADLDGMRWADTCVLVLPCGRSAHLEAGWFAGESRELFVFEPPGAEPSEPELMLKFANGFANNAEQLLSMLRVEGA